MHKKIIFAIKNYVNLSVLEEEMIIDAFSEIFFLKKSYLLKEGNIAGQIFFILEGLTRNFQLIEGKEVNTYLGSDNNFITVYSSFINQVPSVENIQCLEDTTTLAITFSKMQELYEKIPAWQKVGRMLAEQNYLCITDRIFSLQMKSAKQKYLDFLDSADHKIISRTPLLHIASFLGITPESLSRIRREMIIS